MENKTKRFHMLMEPSTHKKLQRLAKQHKCSPSEIVRRGILMQWESKQ